MIADLKLYAKERPVPAACWGTGLVSAIFPRASPGANLRGMQVIVVPNLRDSLHK